MFLFGEKPGFGIKEKTKFIFDVMSCFEKFYDKLAQTVTIPNVLDFLQGTDTNIEIVKSSMLQLARININCYQMIESIGIIFVQNKLQSNTVDTLTGLETQDENDELNCESFIEAEQCLELKPLIYRDAERRALRAEMFFKQIMKLDHVEICEDFTRDEIIKKFDEIEKLSD